MDARKCSTVCALHLCRTALARPTVLTLYVGMSASDVGTKAAGEENLTQDSEQVTPMSAAGDRLFGEGPSLSPHTGFCMGNPYQKLQVCLLLSS